MDGCITASPPVAPGIYSIWRDQMFNNLGGSEEHSLHSKKVLCDFRFKQDKNISLN